MSEKLEQPCSEKWSSVGVDVALLTIVWLLSLIVVNPVGNFPLNDDWSYGLTVKHLIETGDYHPTGWASMTLIANVIWGAIFCLPSGFSFDALRLSTLAASLLGIFGAYWLMAEINQRRSIRLLAALTLAFNPIYYALSNTFMTDILFVTLMISAAIFFLRNLKDGSKSSFLLGTIFSIAAVLSRQVGLAVPLAFAIVAVLKGGFKPRTILCAIIPVILCAATLITFEHWLATTGRLPALYNFNNEQLLKALTKPIKLAGVFLHSTYLCVMYLGFFLSPVLFWCASKYSLSCGRKLIMPITFTAVMITLTIANVLFSKGFMMPLAGNIINKSGIGPLTLRDTYFFPTRTPELPGYFWLAVTLVSLVGSIMLLCQITTVVVNLSPKIFSHALEQNEVLSLFLLMIPVIYLPIFFVNGFIDRYLIPSIPFLAAVILIQKQQVQLRLPVFCKWATILILIGFFIFSVAGTRDYLAWNRVRWAALDDLTGKDKIKPSNIDGGFEFNGLFLYDPNYKVDPKKVSSWWIYDDSYLLTFNTVTNYHVFHESYYSHWMPPYAGSIFVMQKNVANAQNK